MENFAGRKDADAETEAELVAAGIKVERLPEVFREQMGEVKTIIVGWLHGWRFERAWCYWIAKGPGIPPVYSDDLHRSHGKEVRVDGNCTCPSPREWLHGFAVGLYHVDSQEGLNALAQTIKRVVEDAAQSKKTSFGHLARLEPRLAELLLEISREPERVEGSDFCANELWLRAYKPRLILLVGIGLGAEVLQPVLCSSDAYAIAYSTLYDAMPGCRRCGCSG